MAKIEVAGIPALQYFCPPCLRTVTLPLSFDPFLHLAVACEPMSRLVGSFFFNPCSTSKTPFV